MESLPRPPARPTTQGLQMPIPEPLVIRNDAPVKALKLIDNYILLGTDQGDIRVYDRETLEELSVNNVRNLPFKVNSS